jgi:hypothetical protein
MLLLPLLAGCASVVVYRAYEDPSLSADKVARIVGIKKGNHVVFAGLNEQVGIHEVDGEPTFSFWSTALDPVPKEVYVLPGKHELRVRYDYKGTFASARLTVDVAAGKTYAIRMGVETSGYYRFWIEETGSAARGGAAAKP